MKTQVDDDLFAKFLSLGISLKHTWIDFIKSNNYQSFDDIFKAFIFTDIEETSQQNLLLKKNVNNPQYSLLNPITLQVDEIIDISISDKDRLYNLESSNPTFKVLLNSGGYQFSGVIQKSIAQINLESEPGFKITVKPGASLIYGSFVLNEENVVYLGGCSPQLIQKKMNFIKNSLKVTKSVFPIFDSLKDDQDDFSFGLEPTYIFSDFTSQTKRKQKTVLRTPFQFGETIQSDQLSVQKSSEEDTKNAEKSIQNSNLLQENAANEKYTKNANSKKMNLIPQIKNSNSSKTQIKDSNSSKTQIKYSNPSKTQIKDLNSSKNQIKDSNSSKTQIKDLNSSKTQIKDFNSSKTQIKDSNLSKTQIKDLNSSKTQKPSSVTAKRNKNITEFSTKTEKKPPFEISDLFILPEKEKESLIFVDAHVSSLSTNNDPSEEKRAKFPFKVTVQSNKSHQKLDVLLDPLFFELLFNSDFISSLPPEDLLGTAHVCERKIKEILVSPLSFIDKGKGMPSDRFLITK